LEYKLLQKCVRTIYRKKLFIYCILFCMAFTRKRGFSLVELLVVVFLLSIGILGLLTALNRGMKFVQKTRERVIAVNLARE